MPHLYYLIRALWIVASFPYHSIYISNCLQISVRDVEIWDFMERDTMRVEEVSYGNRLVCTSLAFGPSDLCNQVLPSSLVESWKYICLSCSTRWIKIYDNVSKCVRKWKSFVVWKLRKMMEGKFLYSYFERIYYFYQLFIIALR